MVKSGKKSRLKALFALSFFLLIFLTGCCKHTYPACGIRESVIRICKKEYGIDVKVSIVGRTMAIYMSLGDLMDMSFALTKAASEKINDVIFSAARVALSTDAKIDFYCVIAHDVRMPELQIIIIKNVDDIKRLFASDISRGEYMKRMLIDLRWSPQAKKEQVVKEVFNRMNLDPKWQDQVMTDFFRSDPTGLIDIGYWNGRFYIKDITLAEFLAEQIASRIRIEFRDNKALKDNFLLKTARGEYAVKKGVRGFRFDIMAEHNVVGTLLAVEESDKIFETVLSIAGHVIHGYHFNDFGFVEVFDHREGRSIEVTGEELEAFRKKKAKLSEIGK